MMNGWEYCRQSTSDFLAIDRLGLGGWEMVALSGDVAWFKRPYPLCKHENRSKVYPHMCNTCHRDATHSDAEINRCREALKESTER